MKGIHLQFEELKEKIKLTLLTFHKYLCAASRGIPLVQHNLTDEEISKAVHAIQEYYLKTNAFLEAARTIPRIRAIFRRYFCPKCYEVQGRVRQFYHIISLQGYLGQYLPCKLIVDIAFNCFDTNELFKLNQFVQLLVDKCVETKILYLALRALDQNANNYLISKSDEQLNNEPLLARVLCALDAAKTKLGDNGQLSRNHLLFGQEDKEFMAWRNSLKRGSVLSTTLYQQTEEPSKLQRHTVQIHTFVLGDLLSTPRAGKDQKYVFSIQKHRVTTHTYLAGEETFDAVLETVDDSAENKMDCPSKAIYVSYNPAWLDVIESQRYRQVGLNLPQLHFIARDGKFALMERLYSAFGGPEWEATKREPETQTVIINYLKHLCTQATIPEFFNIKYIMLNDKKAMRTFRPTFGKPFALQPVEKFALDLAGKDQTLFYEFLQKSGVNTHRHALFLREAALASFTKPPLDLKRKCDAAAIPEDERDALVKQATELQNEINRIYNECLQTLDHKTTQTLSGDIKSKVQINLLEAYKKSAATTLFPHNFKEEVIATSEQWLPK